MYQAKMQCKKAGKLDMPKETENLLPLEHALALSSDACKVSMLYHPKQTLKPQKSLTGCIESAQVLCEFASMLSLYRGQQLSVWPHRRL